jgi:glycosyltransferase involved in cell wall biosynthesis
MIKFSVVVPVFNRPEEIRELLESLSCQTYKDFEVIIVEDGSGICCDKIVHQFKELLNVHYFLKPNSGPGLSRNYGVEKASGNYFIFLDSDCVIPQQYIEVLHREISAKGIQCFGGPDLAHASFTNVQKAISYSMTSFFTTGGIRGGSRKVIKFHPRSFNMGFSEEVFRATQGFAPMRFGEDIDLSLRIEAHGFQCALIGGAYVYHKRRTDFKKFFKQIYNSGIARINLYKRHPSSLKLTHFFPAAFVIAFVVSAIACLFFKNALFFLPMVAYLFLIAGDASYQNKSIKIGSLAVIATLVQMFAYGSGFIKAFIFRIIFGKKEFSAFEQNFYK